MVSALCGKWSLDVWDSIGEMEPVRGDREECLARTGPWAGDYQGLIAIKDLNLPA